MGNIIQPNTYYRCNSNSPSWSRACRNTFPAIIPPSRSEKPKFVFFMIHDNPNNEDEAGYGDANDEHFLTVLQNF